MLLYLRSFYSLLVLILVINNVNGRIPQELEKKEMCVGRRFAGDKNMRSLQFYDKELKEVHALFCGNPTFALTDDYKPVLVSNCSSTPCFTFTGLESFQFGESTEEEYGLNEGMFPTPTVYNDRWALYWSNPVGYPQHCDVSSVWNVFYIINYDDRNNQCPSRDPDKDLTDEAKVFVLSITKNQERGFPVVVIDNSIITKPENLIPIGENGCNTLPPEIICIRLVNSKITEHAPEIHPPDVKKAIDAVRKELKSKMGGEDGPPEHPRQMLNYIMLGGSLLLLIAVIASIFAIPKDHDFPIMYQKGVATVGKKAKKGKKKGDKTGNGSTGLGGQTKTGLSGIGKTGKTTTGMSGMGKSSKMAGKTTGSNMTEAGKKDKKDKKDKKGKKDKKKGKK